MSGFPSLQYLDGIAVRITSMVKEDLSIMLSKAGCSLDSVAVEVSSRTTPDTFFHLHIKGEAWTEMPSLAEVFRSNRRHGLMKAFHCCRFLK